MDEEALLRGVLAAPRTTILLAVLILALVIILSAIAVMSSRGNCA